MDASDEIREFSTGAIRDAADKKPMLQLISPFALMRLGEWMRFACKDRKPEPYPARNWEKGMPFSEVIGSLERHVQKWKMGDRSEDHLAAVMFNTMALIHLQEMIDRGVLPRELDDMPSYGPSRLWVERKPEDGCYLSVATPAKEL